MIIRLYHAGLLPASARRPTALKSAARRALRAEGADAPGELSIVFLDRRAMRAMNKRFLGRTHDTDVIAFRYPPDSKAPRRKDEPFGDVYISAPQAALQAREQGHPVLTEACLLVIHGVLHLLGWEDERPREKARMFRRQDELLGGKAKARRR